MKPLIGIVGKSDMSKKEKNTICVFDNYRKAIIYYGGIPFLILPPQIVNYEEASGNEIGHLTKDDIEILNRQLRLCDGVVLTGGTKSFEYDKYIVDYTNKNKIPLLGICMGMQTMCNYNNNNKNILNNNDLHHKPDEDYVHDVIINENSKLYKIIKNNRLKVNSNHRYHVSNSGSYKIAALSTDNLIEAVENEYGIGLQWHPEKNYKSEDSEKIFLNFINNTKKNSISKNSL